MDRRYYFSAHYRAEYRPIVMTFAAKPIARPDKPGEISYRNDSLILSASPCGGVPCCQRGDGRARSVADLNRRTQRICAVKAHENEAIHSTVTVTVGV